jgi:hypothetical protein
MWANEEYRSQLGATNRPENTVISYDVSSLSRLGACKIVDVFSFHLQFSLLFRSAFAQIFPRSQPMRESNTSTTTL